MKISLMIVAAGEGKRFGIPKWKVQLAGKTLLQRNLELFHELPFSDREIILVTPQSDLEWIRQHLPEAFQDLQLVAGGNQRVDSVKAGLEACTGEIIVIHNVANPMATVEDFQRLVAAVEAQRIICCVGQPVVDTLRKVEAYRFMTVPREAMWRIQTPQAFPAEALRKQIAMAGPHVTDEISLFEQSDHPFKVFPTHPLNTKVTFPEDLDVLEQVLSSEFLVGLGEDSHSFDQTGTIVLGGVKVDGVPKLKGNSDGDLVLHALFNAISSALGKRSIGPTADPMAEQGIIDSSEYLRVLLSDMSSAGFQVRNVSISIEGSYPKIEPIVEPMKQFIAELLGVHPADVGITATTGEKLSSFGRGEGVKCTCLVSLVRVS